MRIFHKLLAGAVAAACALVLVGSHSASVTESELKNAVEQEMVGQTHALAQEISRMLEIRLAECRWYARTHWVQQELAASNKRYEDLPDAQAFVSRQNDAWTSSNKQTAFMKSIEDSPLAENLRAHLRSLESAPGRVAFGEAFLTNRFGANVVQTNTTSDFRQDDEEWWQAAWKDGAHVGDVEFDESAGMFSLVMCVRAESKEGTPLGVLKAVLNLEELFHVIDERAEVVSKSGIPKTDVLLFSRSGALIHRSGEDHVNLLGGRPEYLPRQSPA